MVKNSGKTFTIKDTYSTVLIHGVNNQKLLGFSLLFGTMPQDADHSFPTRKWTHEPYSENLQTLDHQGSALVLFPKWFGNPSMYNMDWYEQDRCDTLSRRL